MYFFQVPKRKANTYTVVENSLGIVASRLIPRHLCDIYEYLKYEGWEVVNLRVARGSK